MAKKPAKPSTLELDHDDLIAALIKTRNKIDRQQVVSAFVVSLRAKRLDLRSPLGSYAFHLNHPRHKLDARVERADPNASYLSCTRCPYFSNSGSRVCEVSFRHVGALRSKSTVSSNFASPSYALADLSLFSEAEMPPVEDDDWDLIRQLLARIRKLPADARHGDLQKSLVGLFKSDTYARRQVLEILGFCGILQPRSRPLVTDRFFCRDKDQFHPHFHTRDWAYPVSWWTGADGVNDRAVAFWFPEGVR